VAGGLYRTYSAPRPENVLGWARVLVLSSGNVLTGEPPVFEGAFSVDGDVHHVSTLDNFLLTKRSFDSMPSPPEDPLDRGLVIFRNSDLVHNDAPQMCSHDSLSFNTDPTINPSLRQPAPAPGWLESLLPGNLTRRDDINGGEVGNNYISSIGDSSGCPKTQQIVYMGVAADCKYVSNYQSAENATKAILSDWSKASSNYKVRCVLRVDRR